MEKIPLKDQLLSRQRVMRIADEIHRVYPAFDKKAFVNAVLNTFPQLELTPRVKWIRECFKTFLPDDYRTAVTILLKSLPPLSDELFESDFGVYIYAPYSDFVATYGCNKKDLQFSLATLKEMTKRFSAEDAIRYFINAFPQQTFKELLTWSKDEDYRIRRLASEGTRPNLPWSKKISSPIEDALPILNDLYSDNNRFVTRSVANHLNDISKIRPKIVFATLKKWQKSEKQIPKEMEFIINQSLRTLIKKGDKDAIRFLSISTDPNVSISDFKLKNNHVRIGHFLEFSFTLTAEKDERLIIDHRIYFRNKAGNGYNQKVFKLKKVVMKKGQTLHIAKKQPMRQTSTRKLYPGKHKIEMYVNGNNIAEKTFSVIKESP